jgi:hypothetical protein
MADKGEKKHDKHVVSQKGKTGNAKVEAKEQSRGNEGALREPWQMEDTTSNEVDVPAIHHVGPTLESDPEFNDIPSSRPTPEAVIDKFGVPLPGEGVDRDIDALPELENRTARGERLRTHLAGDTSSNPHTDVGPDNATTVQHRGEPQPREQEHRGKRKRHAA